VRDAIARLLDWGDAHVTLDGALKGLPAALRGRVPRGMPHSIWQLVEHLRLAQRDILEFTVAKRYRPMQWPDDYWPKRPAPPSAAAWRKSLTDHRRDLRALQTLARDTSVPLESKVPNGDGQTVLRELLLVADHTAYHVGQIVSVRSALGAWPPR
jgi:uncharacterized damage-inducible protein DinB